MAEETTAALFVPTEEWASRMVKEMEGNMLCASPAYTAGAAAPCPNTAAPGLLGCRSGRRTEPDHKPGDGQPSA